MVQGRGGRHVGGVSPPRHLEHGPNMAVSSTLSTRCCSGQC